MGWKDRHSKGGHREGQDRTIEDDMGKSKTDTGQTPKTGNRGHREITSGTVVARLMKERGLKKRHLGHVLECSDRHLTRYLTREYPVPMSRMLELEELFDLDIDELVDDKGYLRVDQRSR